MIISLIFSGFSTISFGQETIKGTIYDAKTKETIVGVAVYLDGTSIITTSDTDGKFELVVPGKINANLVLSHLSYEPLVVEKPFEHRENKFYLSEKVNILTDVTVVADRYWRAAKIAVFKDECLGKSDAGKSCVVVNEDDIVLNYNAGTNTLVGYANNPIVIENRFLAYRIVCDLQHFSVQYSENTLMPDKIVQVSFKGTFSFIDQSPFNIMYAKRRERLYLHSSSYFWKNFISHTLESAKCRVYNRHLRIDPKQYFLVSELLNQKALQILPNTKLQRKHPRVPDVPVFGVMGITCNGERSDVVFLTDRIFFDDFGNPDSVDSLVYFGEMGKQRLGDMLPRDFIYRQSSQ